MIFDKLMKMKIICIYIFLLIMVGCAQRVKVPINRFISPEAIGYGVDLEYQQAGFSEGKLDFSDDKTDNALIMGSVSNRALYMGLGLSPTVDVFIKVPQESSSLLGLKVQLIGNPSKARSSGHLLAFTIAMGAERDSFEGQFKIKLKSDVEDYSVIYGYRLNELVLFYSSLSLSNYDFSGTIEDSSGTLDSDSLSYRSNNTLGFQLGTELGGPKFAIKGEFGVQEISWTNTDKKLFYFSGIALRTTF